MAELGARLEAVIRERLAKAKAANPSPWRRITDKSHLDPNTIFGDGSPRGFDKLRNVCSLEYSWERDANAEHIMANDPADAILAAEHALGILERHTQIEQPNWSRARGTFSTPACLHCKLFSNDGDPLYEDWPCDEVKALVVRYGVEAEEVSRP